MTQKQIDNYELMLRKGDGKDNIKVHITKNSISKEPLALKDLIFEKFEYFVKEPNDISDKLKSELIIYIMQEYRLFYESKRTGLTQSEVLIDENVDLISDILKKEKAFTAIHKEISKGSYNGLEKLGASSIERGLKALFDKTGNKIYKKFKKEEKIELTPIDKTIIKNKEAIIDIVQENGYKIVKSSEKIRELQIKGLEKLRPQTLAESFKRIFALTLEDVFDIETYAAQSVQEKLEKNKAKIKAMYEKPTTKEAFLAQFRELMGINGWDDRVLKRMVIDLLQLDIKTVDFKEIKENIRNPKETKMFENEEAILEKLEKRAYNIDKILRDEIIEIIGFSELTNAEVEEYLQKRYVQTSEDKFNFEFQRTLDEEKKARRLGKEEQIKLLKEKISIDVVERVEENLDYDLNDIVKEVRKSPTTMREMTYNMFIERLNEYYELKGEDKNYAQLRKNKVIEKYKIEELYTKPKDKTGSQHSEMLQILSIEELSKKYKTSKSLLQYVKSGDYTKFVNNIKTKIKDYNYKKDYIDAMSVYIVETIGQPLLDELPELENTHKSRSEELVIESLNLIYLDKVGVKKVIFDKKRDGDIEKLETPEEKVLLLNSVLEQDFIEEGELEKLIEKLIDLVKYKTDNNVTQDLNDSRKTELKSILFTYFKTDFANDMEMYGDRLYEELPDGKIELTSKIFKIINARTINFAKTAKEMIMPFSFVKDRKTQEEKVYFNIGGAGDLDTCYHSPYDNTLYTASATTDKEKILHEELYTKYLMKTAWYQYQLDRNNISSSISKDPKTQKVREKSAATQIKLKLMERKEYDAEGKLKEKSGFSDKAIELVRAKDFVNKIKKAVKELNSEEREKFEKIKNECVITFMYGGRFDNQGYDYYYMVNAIGDVIENMEARLKTTLLQYSIENEIPYTQLLLEELENKSIIFDTKGLIENEIIFDKSMEIITKTINTINAINSEKVNKRDLQDLYKMIFVLSNKYGKQSEYINSMAKISNRFFDNFVRDDRRTTEESTAITNQKQIFSKILKAAVEAVEKLGYEDGEVGEKEIEQLVGKSIELFKYLNKPSQLDVVKEENKKIVSYSREQNKEANLANKLSSKKKSKEP